MISGKISKLNNKVKVKEYVIEKKYKTKQNTDI